MKAYLGPYKHFFGVYQLFAILRILGFSKSRTNDWAHATDKKFPWLNKFFNWIHEKRKRRVVIKTHPYDHWNAHTTISQLALPILKDLRGAKHSYGLIDDEDVPEHLRSDKVPPKEHEWDVDDNAHARYNWVLEEIIWAMASDVGEDPDFDDERPISADGFDDIIAAINEPIDYEKYPYQKRKEFEARKDNGFRLFGKYYQTLWD